MLGNKLKRTVLVTGGAGFIGVNAACRFLEEGWEVVVWDNLSRCGAERNLRWLREAGKFRLVRLDLRSEKSVNRQMASARFDFILHCAAQVAVTLSVGNPREDFEGNVLGTFNLLEGMRRFSPEAFLIFASSNKVYGAMEGLRIRERGGRYEYAGLPDGVSEQQPLDFYTPYGCSKGAADQYVHDYSRIYGLATTCFRQSCIYGYRQFGIEDQGWIAWFMIAHALGRPVTVYGDGKQTRDILFIEDLVEAYCLAWKHRRKLAGQVYNIGGGPRNQYSLLQLVKFLEADGGGRVRLKFAPPRLGDQKVFVSDIRKAARDFGWKPAWRGEVGLRKLQEWVKANAAMFREVLREKKLSAPAARKK
jgi:CDP-paratose 2-epimerase